MSQAEEFYLEYRHRIPFYCTTTTTTRPTAYFVKKIFTIFSPIICMHFCLLFLYEILNESSNDNCLQCKMTNWGYFCWPFWVGYYGDAWRMEVLLFQCWPLLIVKSQICINPPMVWPFKICLLAKWLSICLNLLKHSIIFCYCTTTPFKTLWKDLKGRKIGLWYVCSESCFTFQNLS